MEADDSDGDEKEEIGEIHDDFFPNFDGTKDSSKYEPEVVNTNAGAIENWKDTAYFRLPENVRKAVDIAKLKSHHSEFWYKL